MNRLIIVPAALAALCFAALPLMAADGNPGFMNPGSFDAADPNAETNATDMIFARETARGGRAEVELASLVGGKAKADAVQEHARLMQKDHSRSNEELAGIAEKHKIALPKELTPDQKAARARLEKLAGRELEVAYLVMQVADHQKTAHLLVWEIGGGQNASLKEFAEKTLPVVLSHLGSAKAALAARRMAAE